MDAATETLLAAITAALADFKVEIADPRTKGPCAGKVWTYTARVQLRDAHYGTVSVTVDQDGIIDAERSQEMLNTARAMVKAHLTAADRPHTEIKMNAAQKTAHAALYAAAAAYAAMGGPARKFYTLAQIKAAKAARDAAAKAAAESMGDE